MRVLSISLDSKIIDKKKSVLDRMARYGEIADKYTLVVADKRKDQVEISEQVCAYGSGGSNKFSKFFHIYFLASKLLRTQDFDIITTQNPLFVGLIGVLLKKRHGVKLEFQIHGWKKGYNWLLKYNLKQADGIRVVSNRIKDKLVEEYNLDPEIISVIPIIEKGEIKKKKQDYAADEPFTFFSAQRLVSVKNVSLQIEAIEALKEKGYKVKLLIAGKGERKEKLEQLVKEKDLQDEVDFLGWLDKEKLKALYLEADSFILTSDSEGWGRTVVEAAARGLPIIMTDVGCAGEFIKDQKNGLVISIKNLSELQQAMERMIEDQDLRKKLGTNAKESYQNLPTRKELLNKYYQAWNQIK